MFQRLANSGHIPTDWQIEETSCTNAGDLATKVGDNLISVRAWVAILVVVCDPPFNTALNDILENDTTPCRSI